MVYKRTKLVLLMFMGTIRDEYNGNQNIIVRTGTDLFTNVPDTLLNCKI